MNKIKKIINAITFGYFVYKQPDAFSESVFIAMSDILTMITKVAVEDVPYLADFNVFLSDKNVKQPVVHIWAGNGIHADPIKRIRELVEENDLLKEQIKKKGMVNNGKRKIHKSNPNNL